MTDGPTVARYIGAAGQNWLAVECVHRSTLPEWMKGAYSRSVAARQGPRHMPVVVITEGGEPIGKSFIMMELCEFRDRFL